MPLPLCARVEDDQSAKSLERDGWQQIETLEIWEGEIDWLDTPGVRKAEHKDLEFCMGLAKRSFVFDRLHQDKTVPKGVADNEKASFVMRAFNGNYEIYVIPLAGFVIFSGNAISLIAVDESRRNRGHAQLLCRAKGGRITAGTQSDNLPAKKLYKSLGMERVRTLRSYHKWL